MKANRTKGMSMMELIIVVALIGIFTGMTSLSFGYITSGNVKKAAKTIDSNLTQLRYDALSRKDKPCMYLYTVNGKNYMYCTAKSMSYSDLKGADGTLLSNQTCTITYDNDQKIPNNGFIKIVYKKGSGGFSDASDVKSCIIITKDEKKYKITLYKETGKHKFEMM